MDRLQGLGAEPAAACAAASGGAAASVAAAGALPQAILATLWRRTWSRWQCLGLQARTLIVVAATMAAVVGTADNIDLRHERASGLERLQVRADSLATNFADTLMQPLWHFAHDQVSGIVAAAARNADFMMIEVRDHRNELIAAHYLPDRNERYVEARRDVVRLDRAERQAIGSVRLRLSTVRIESQHHRAIVLSLGKFALVLVVTMAAISAALRVIMRPLGQMTNIMTRIAAGEHGLPIPATDRPDEVGDMARAVAVFKHHAAEMQRLSVEQERLRAREHQLILRRRVRAAIDSTAQAIALFDPDDLLVECNTAFLELHRGPNGVRPTKKAVLGCSGRDLLHLRVRNGLYRLGDDSPEQFIASHSAWHEAAEGVEHTFQIADGRWLHVLQRRTPDRDRIYMITDVSNIKAAESRRLELENQLHHSQRLEALGTLAGGIAHDLNNSLVPILGLSRLVAESLPEGSVQRTSLEMIADGGERAKKLVSQILTFSRKDQHQLQSLDFAELLREALTMLRAALPATIRLQQDIANVPPIEGDKAQLHQVVVNLVTNASQAIGAKTGVIAIRLCVERVGESDAAIRLSVQDDGCGMDEATRARVFEPFFTTKAVNEGTGLGLAIVHGIVVAHRGSLSVDSARGAGTTFNMTLPVARSDGANGEESRSCRP